MVLHGTSLILKINARPTQVYTRTLFLLNILKINARPTQVQALYTLTGYEPKFVLRISVVNLCSYIYLHIIKNNYL